MSEPEPFPSSRLLMQLGAIMLFLGLATGLVVPIAEVPRMALASHLEGVMNGVVLIVVGLAWRRLALGAVTRKIAFWCFVYGAFANWAATLIAAFTGAVSMMPLAGGEASGPPFAEGLVAFLLLSLSAAMLAGAGLLVYGLRKTYSPAKSN